MNNSTEYKVRGPCTNLNGVAPSNSMDGDTPSVDSLHISLLLGVGEANLIGKLFSHIDRISSCIQQCLERLTIDKGVYIHVPMRLFLHFRVDLIE